MENIQILNLRGLMDKMLVEEHYLKACVEVKGVMYWVYLHKGYLTVTNVDGAILHTSKIKRAREVIAVVRNIKEVVSI